LAFTLDAFANPVNLTSFMGLPIAGFKASCLHCFITSNMKHEFLLIITPEVKTSVKQKLQWYKLVAKPTPILA
jgi:hypothetical protein